MNGPTPWGRRAGWPSSGGSADVSVVSRSAHWLIVLTISLLASGCGNPLGSHLSGTTFDVGQAEDYRTPDVYDRHLAAHHVWIVSFGGMVVALSDACPRDGRTLYFDEVPRQFKCTHCAARFDSNGLPRAPAGEERSMVRLRIEPTDKRARGPSVALKVNPRFQFRQDKGEWSRRFSMHVLDPG